MKSFVIIICLASIGIAQNLSFNKLSTLVFTDNTTLKTIDVYNIQGKRVMSKTGNGTSLSLPTNSLSGVFSIVVSTRANIYHAKAVFFKGQCFQKNITFSSQRALLPGPITQSIASNGNVAMLIDKKVKKFMDTLKMGVYRSGLIDQKSTELYWLKDGAQTPDFDDAVMVKPVSEAGFQGWKAEKDGEFEIIYGPPRAGQLATITKLTSDYGLTIYTFDSTISENRFSNVIDPAVIENKILSGPAVDEAKAVEDLKTIGATMLSVFRGKIEFAGVDIEYVEGKVVFITLNYRRLFRHGIIGVGTSYIHVKMGADGTPLSLCIKWPSFKSISRNEPAVPISYAFDRVVQVFALSDTAQKGNNYLKVSSYTIDGVAFAWLTISRNKNIITPGYCFIAKAFLGDGTTAFNSLDAPRLKKYYLK